MKVSEFINAIIGAGRQSDDIVFKVTGYGQRTQDLDGTYHGAYDDSFEIDSEVEMYEVDRKNRVVTVTFDISGVGGVANVF